MPAFRFVGDPHRNGDGPDIIEAFGHAFVRDSGTEVADPVSVAKLRGNSHFAEVKPDRPTIAELEAILREDDKKVTILPDGSVLVGHPEAVPLPAAAELEPLPERELRDDEPPEPVDDGQVDPLDELAPRRKPGRPRKVA